MKPDIQLSLFSGNTEGRLLVVETVFARRAREIPLSELQVELLVGSLLGDGYLMPTTSGWCFRVHHGIRQLSYVSWKPDLLAGYIRSGPRVCGRSCYFRTITHPAFAALRALFYEGARKRVPVGLLEERLTPFGLAVWFMDDGCSDRRHVRINTQSFSLTENIELVRILQAKFGLDARLNRDKDRYRLRIGTGGIDQFTSLITPYVVPSMLYKLPP